MIHMMKYHCSGNGWTTKWNQTEEPNSALAEIRMALEMNKYNLDPYHWIFILLKNKPTRCFTFIGVTGARFNIIFPHICV